MSAEVYRLFSWLPLSHWANYCVSFDRSDKSLQDFSERSYLHGALRDHYSKSGHWTRVLAGCPAFTWLDVPQKNKLRFEGKDQAVRWVRNEKTSKNVPTYQISVDFFKIQFIMCGEFSQCNRFCFMFLITWPLMAGEKNQQVFCLFLIGQMYQTLDLSSWRSSLLASEAVNRHHKPVVRNLWENEAGWMQRDSIPRLLLFFTPV